MFLITFMELPSHSFVVAAVQEQRPNVGTTRTLLLQNNAAAHKTLVTILYLEGETSSAPPTAQPCDCWLFVVVVFTLKIGLAEKKKKIKKTHKVLENSKPSKSGGFTTSFHSVWSTTTA